MGIRILVTGGTFDKHYDAIRGVLAFKDTHLPEILRQANIDVPAVLEINQLIDSLDMQEGNRASILEACRRSPEDRILVTHGTDTMAETAAWIGRAGLPKTVVLTGAMVPYAFGGSDALFNLGCAFSAVQLLPPGCWLAMNGRVFPWNRVRKNRDRGIFEEIPEGA